MMTVEIERGCYQFICYNSKGEVLGEFFQMDWPTPSDFPAGTVRVDIALPDKGRS